MGCRLDLVQLWEGNTHNLSIAKERIWSVAITSDLDERQNTETDTNSVKVEIASLHSVLVK